MPLLTCQALTRAPFLRDVSFALEAGEVATLSGPSGSGKSLLLRAVADLDPIDSGVVQLRGRDRSSYAGSEWRTRVTYVHPGGVLAAETLGAHANRLAKLQAFSARASGAPAFAHDSNRETATLSGGERQSVALASALALAPDVLLLDEATSAMDPALATSSEREILEFAAGGRAVLWITHDTSIAPRIGARSLVLSELSAP